MQENFYTLPVLMYSYKDLEPYVSEGQLIIHHQKHHQTYVAGANTLLQRLMENRQNDADTDGYENVLKVAIF